MTRIFRKTPAPYRDKERESIQRRRKLDDRARFIAEMLGGQCRVCRKPTKEKLWFEYVGNEPKARRMASILSMKITTVMQEAKNFKLLCKKHWWERKKKDAGKRRHGTVSMYAAGLCRKECCRAPWREYTKKWQQRKRDQRKEALRLLKEGKLSFLKII